MNNLLNSIPVKMKNVHLKEGFWHRYAQLVRDVVIPYQWDALNDKIPDAAPSHAIKNFKIAAGVETGKFGGCVFQDSDVAKWLEAVGYSLEGNTNDEFEKWADEAIDFIAKAQQEDGYLNTFFTIERPGERWTNLFECHELYCAGHMMEAAVAYYNATGKRKLLDVMCRFADYIDSVFGSGEGKLHGYDGHEEIELALVKLYKAAGNEKYLKLSKYFIDERGKEPNFLLGEWEKREKISFWNPSNRNKPDVRYNQAHIPVREQTKAVGHAVRAVYLYTGMADIAALTGDEDLKNTCKTIWSNIVTKRMYITGGIGSTRIGEAFTFDYDLPNDTVYQETCASIGLVFFAHRMLQMEADSSYADVMERALFNSIIGGMGLDGKSFLYVNPMEVWPEAGDKNPDRQHIKSVRQKWYGCACCPPNLARLLVSLQEYIYTYNFETIYTHLYIPSETNLVMDGEQIKIEQETTYPWDGKVKIKVNLEKDKMFTIAVRVPGWCRNFELNINDKSCKADGHIEKGYIYINRIWKDKDEILINMDMPVELIKSHPNVRANAGKVAIQRGPLVYCLEEADNGTNLSAISIGTDPGFAAQTDETIPGTAVTVKGKAVRIKEKSWDNSLYKPYLRSEEEVDIKAIPYYLWGNRKPGEMLVWINHK